MAETYRAVMLTKAGGPEVLQVVDLPVESPGPGQLRVRVRAAGVGSTDLIVLAGKYRYAPKIPLVPGYEVAGVVDALGAGVTGFEVGQRVAALTVYGGFAELIVREAEHFLPIPDGVSDRDAAAVILNYVTAWQMIYRVAKVQRGQTALVTGAAGGVGTAALQLLRLAGVRTYGAASAAKHNTLRSLGATPIDYRAGPLDRLTRALEPEWRRLRVRRDRRRQHRSVHRRAAAGRDAGRIRLHGRVRIAFAVSHVRQYFPGCAAARTGGQILRHHDAIPERSPAAARGSAQDLRAARGEEDRSTSQSHVSAA